MKVRLTTVLAEVEERQSWFCATCSTMVETGREGEKHCRTCRDYWSDVAAGLFDDDRDLRESFP